MSKIDILSGLNVVGQFPLNSKENFKTLAEMQDLGSSDVNAYKYYEGMIVMCNETKKQYQWREPVIENEVGVLASHFTYPASIISDGIDYSNRSFNFFEYIEESEETDTERIDKIYGGTVYPLGGLNYRSTPIQYRISNIEYSVDITNLTIDAAHPTLNRRDIFVVDTTGVVKIKKGVEAVNPQEPDVITGRELRVSSVYIPATATQPQGVSLALVYNENAGSGGIPSEWNSSYIAGGGAVIDLASTNNPNKGAICIETTDITPVNIIKLTSPNLVSLAKLSSLKFGIRNKSTENYMLDVVLKRQGIAVASLTIVSGDYTFDTSDNSAYQVINIPAVDLGINTVSDIDSIEFNLNESVTDIEGFYLDDIELIYGVENPTNDNTFLALSDVGVSNYAGKRGKGFKVNDNETGIEEVDLINIKDVYPNNTLIDGSAFPDGNGGLTFNVVVSRYVLNGVLLPSEIISTTITLPNGDGTHPRKDLILVDAEGNISSVQGVPAASPAEPPFDYNSYVVITVVDVAQGATSPTNLNTALIYGENVGEPSEWTATENTGAARINVDSSSNPDTGTKAINVTGVTFGDKIVFTNDVFIDKDTVGGISFRAFLKEAIPFQIGIYFYNDLTLVSNRYFKVEDGAYGLNLNLLNVYQTIQIPKEVLDLTDDFDSIELRFIPKGSFGASMPSADYDNFKLIIGSETNIPVNSFLNFIDTPSSYTGFEGYKVKVKADGTGLEFVADPPAKSVKNRYADIATMIADQGNQADGDVEYVTDASTDTTVDSGYAYYEYLGTTVGNLTDYKKLSEEESMDVPEKTNLSEFNNDVPYLTEGVVPQTYYVATTSGDNTTAEAGSVSKPYKTIDAVLNLFSNNQGASFTIVLTEPGNYPINVLIPANYIEIKSNLVVTIDFSANAGHVDSESTFYEAYNQGGLTNRSSLYFNIPNGTLQNDRGGAVLSAGLLQSQTKFKLNIGTINWQTTSPIFYADNVDCEYIGTFNSLGRFGFTGAICGNFNASTIIIAATALDRILKGVYGNIDVNVLTINNTQCHIESGQTWNIGSTVNGTGQFRLWYHTGTSNLNFNNTTFYIDFDFEQTIGVINMSGVINSVTFVDRFKTGTLNLQNLIIKSQTGPIASWNAGIINVTNCVVNVDGIFIEKDSANATELTVTIKNSAVTQSIPQELIRCNSGTVSASIGGLETNALSIGNNSNVLVNFFLQSFKDKSKEIVVRSKVDIIDKILDSDTTYIIDGTITLLTGERIIIPSTGLTITGYGFNVSKIVKNVAGQSIFESEVGGSGDFITNFLEINSGAGSVFDISDVDGTHAIEINDVNFVGCSDLGEIDGYRQFTGTTLGIYGCSDGITLSGTWNGFKLTNTNCFGFGGSGTLFKEGTSLLFNNRMFLNLNVALPTGAVLTDVQPSNFNSNQLLQVNNTNASYNSTIAESNTDTLFPNITENNVKSFWSNNVGLYNTEVLQDVTQKSAAYTLTLRDKIVEATANTFTFTLPTAVGINGKPFIIKNSGAGTVTIDGNAAETIDGNATVALAQYDSITIISNGVNWIII